MKTKEMLEGMKRAGVIKKLPKVYTNMEVRINGQVPRIENFQAVVTGPGDPGTIQINMPGLADKITENREKERIEVLVKEKTREQIGELFRDLAATYGEEEF